MPAAPQGVQAYPGNQLVRLSWAESPGATQYEVFRSLTAGGSRSSVGVVSTNLFTDTGVVNGFEYFYVVVARNAAGVSPASVEVSATPAAASDLHVVSTSPANSATGVTVGSDISVTFSRPFLLATVATSTIQCPLGAARAYTAVGSGGNTVVTLDPAADLPAGTVCTVTLSGQIQDTTGAPMGSDYTFSFTTGSDLHVVSTSPANSATGVTVGSDISVTFSRPFLLATVATSTIQCPLGAARAYTAVGSGGNTVVTLDPAADLPAGTVCTVTLSGQIQDTTGAPMGSDSTFSFTTA